MVNDYNYMGIWYSLRYPFLTNMQLFKGFASKARYVSYIASVREDLLKQEIFLIIQNLKLSGLSS